MSSPPVFNGNGVTPPAPAAVGGRRTTRVPPPRLSSDSSHSTLVGSDPGHVQIPSLSNAKKDTWATTLSMGASELEKGGKALPPVPGKAQPLAPPIGFANAEYHTLYGELHRKLQSRHISMIALVGSIGIGVFLGIGKSLAVGGPLGLLMAYAILGTVCWSVMVSLGEMASHLPVQGGMITLAHRVADPALSVAMGWNYWYCWTTALPAELSAAAIIMDWWTGTQINNAVFISIFLAVVLAINFGGVRTFAETEFWFGWIKVVTIVALIAFGILADVGANPKHEVVGFRYWSNPGPFANEFKGLHGHAGGFAGFCAVFIQAAFSFVGTEISAMAAGETVNPKRNLPRAIRHVWARIILFYLGGSFVIGLLVPSTHPALTNAGGSPSGSPFIIACQLLGVKAFPHVINAALLMSAWSAGSSDLYTASRALYGLAITGGAPRFLARCNRWGVPYVTVGIGAFFGCLAYLSIGNTNDAAGKAFTWLSAMTSTAGLLTWWGVCVTYIRWWQGIKAQKGWGVNRNWMPYRAPWQPLPAWYGLIMLSIILLTNGWTCFIPGNWDNATFITAYLPLCMFATIYFGYKWWNKTELVRADEIDFDSHSRDVIEEDEPEPKNAVERILRRVL